MPQHKQKSKFDQDQTSSSWEKCKKWENFETLQLAAECHSINKNQRFIKIKPVVPEKNAKSENFAIGCRTAFKVYQDQPVVPEKNAKKWRKFWNFTIAAECHSMNKNQSLMKIKPVVPEKNAKKWRKFGNFTIGCRVPQHKQKSKFDQDETSSSWEKCKKLRKLWNFATGCRMPQHEQKSMFDEDQ